MDSLSQINDIPMLEVLERLWIKYSVLGSSLGLWDWWKLSDGRRVNIHLKYANDFSWKGRASGGPFAFVKAFLKLDNSRDVFIRFKDNFGISDTVSTNIYSKKKNQKKTIKIQYHRNR